MTRIEEEAWGPLFGDSFNPRLEENPANQLGGPGGHTTELEHGRL